MSAMPLHAWYAVAHGRDVGTAPVGVRILGHPIVLFRGASGLAALRDRCPHRHAPLSEGRVVQGALQCPYHGWSFSEDGHCSSIPGWQGEPDTPSRRVDAMAVREQDGLIWLCAGTPPQADPPRLSLAAQQGVNTLRWRFRAEADPVDALENFLDPTHTHFVHPGLVRRQGARREVPVVVRSLPGGVEAVYTEPEQSGLIARIFGGGIVRSYGRYLWPGLAQLGYLDATGAERMVITASFVPTGAHLDLIAVVSGRPPAAVPGWLAAALVAPLLKRTVAQDRTILERVARHRARDPQPASYVTSPTDLLRPHIERLLADPDRRTPTAERHTRLEL